MRRGERGSVTAEFAVALPAVVLLVALLLAALNVGSLGVRAHDAAGLGARSIARGGSSADAEAQVRSLVPGASLSRTDRSGLICVVVGVRPQGMLSAVEVLAESCALGEP